jgi:succinate dehydrogenase / fumarate reductase membrane anchor subunit
MAQGTPLGKVRGLGSAKSGAEHWWKERLNSVSTLILSVWLLVSLLRLPDLSHETILAWLSSPLAAVPMLLFIVSTFHHLKLGMQVVIEDYVHEEGTKLFSIALLYFFAIGGGALAFFAVLKIAFGGAGGNG